MPNTLLQQLPALLGVGVGAVATIATTSFNDRARWRRERTARWDQRRLQAYVDYGDAVKRVYVLSARIAAGRGLPHSADPLAPDAASLALLGEAEGARSRAFESVLLLGDPETILAARHWHQCGWRVEWFARGRLTDLGQWDEALGDFEAARGAFYERARSDLGVTGAVPAPMAWPPPWAGDADPSP